MADHDKEILPLGDGSGASGHPITARKQAGQVTVSGVKRKELSTAEVVFVVEMICLAAALSMPITPTRSGRTLGDLVRLLVGEASYLEQVATFFVFNNFAAGLLWALNLYYLRREREASRTNRNVPA